MAIRTTIRDLLVTRLKEINGTGVFNSNVNDNVFSFAKFIDEINDWPTICFIGITEGREFIETSSTRGFLEITLRLYTQGDDSDFQDLQDNLIDDVTYVIDNNFDNSDILDAFITRLSTDSGLLRPQGITDIDILVSYCL